MSAITVAKVRSFAPLFFAWFRRGWIYIAALAAALYAFSSSYTIAINASESLPQHVFLVHKRDLELKPGDFAAFVWIGNRPYPAGLNFIKQIGGVAGQAVTVQGREFFVDGVSMGTARTHGSRGNMRGVPLELGPTGTIPAGQYFVHADYPDSLDSRYSLMGWVPQERIVGRATPLF